MKVVQPFLLGGVGGLALSLLIALGLFASPLRRGLYLDWDPEIQVLRQKLDGLNEKLVSVEFGIAEAEKSLPGDEPQVQRVRTDRRADSLKASQAGSWKEYRHWRNRLAELSRHHDAPDPGGFPPWVYSLRYLLGPIALILFLLPAGFFALRAVRRGPSRGARGIPRPSQGSRGAEGPAPEAAMASLEAAVKQVARIAARNESPGGPGGPGGLDGAGGTEGRGVPGGKVKGNRQVSEERETEYLPEVPKRIVAVRPSEADGPVDSGAARTRAYRDALREEPPASSEPSVAPAEEILQAPEPSPYEVSDHGFRIPETAPLPIPSGQEPRPEGLETQIIKLGPGGWGEARRNPEPPRETPKPAAPGLAMEDEDGGESPEAEEEPPPGAFMPPTTEVERVERRKAEVLKLARKGLTSSEISRRMRISQDQVEFIIRMRREKG
jgi:hypothetical protein